MLDALAEDFRRLPGVNVGTLEARRVGEEAQPCFDRESFRRMAAWADWSVVIAPESSGILFDLCQLAESAGGRLLGPSPAIVSLTGDKWATYQHLHKVGAPTPRTWLADDAHVLEEARFPLVQKPTDGAGSIDTILIRNAVQIHRRPGFLLQEFIPGTPASVALLCGPDRIVPLVPGYQRISDDGQFRYLGGRLPLPPALAERATALATSVVSTLPHPRGYLGVDLVLGESADGSGDAVIEINPRLTTSYVGLRALAEDNLAEAMLRIARGERSPEIRWKPGTIAFSADGRVER